jgi:heat shock protein HslJ
MNQKYLWIIGVLVAGLVVIAVIISQYAGARSGGQQNPSNNDVSPTEKPAQGRASTDPQRLMIPRWILSSLVLDGKEYTLPARQVSVQFEEGGKANGEGGCNNFFTEYQAGMDGKMQFGPVGATKMACTEGMEAENAYFQALAKVSQFKTEDWKLFMTSPDGKTSLVFRMPPK